jgi:hypothetical protein
MDLTQAKMEGHVPFDKPHEISWLQWEQEGPNSWIFRQGEVSITLFRQTSNGFILHWREFPSDRRVFKASTLEDAMREADCMIEKRAKEIILSLERLIRAQSE